MAQPVQPSSAALGGAPRVQPLTRQEIGEKLRRMTAEEVQSVYQKFTQAFAETLQLDATRLDHRQYLCQVEAQLRTDLIADVRNGVWASLLLSGFAYTPGSLLRVIQCNDPTYVPSEDVRRILEIDYRIHLTLDTRETAEKAHLVFLIQQKLDGKELPSLSFSISEKI